MRGCAANCLGLVLLYAAIVGGIIYWLQQTHGIGADQSLAMSAIAAALAWLGVAFLYGIRQPAREHAALRAGLRGDSPRDRRITAIFGRIEPIGAPLRAPLSGADCVAYRYEIYKEVRGNKTNYKQVKYDGLALVPSMITSSSFTCRLLAVPDFDFPSQALDRDAAVANAAEHIRATTFQKPRDKDFGTYVSMQATDDDGAYRWEENHSEDEEVALAECQFAEHHIGRGENVCVVGLYSAERRGLVPHANWAKPTRVMKGDAETVLRQLRGRIIGYSIGGVAFGAMAIGLVKLFLEAPDMF